MHDLSDAGLERRPEQGDSEPDHDDARLPSEARITHGDGLTSVPGGFAIVEDCGHILTWEKPEALAQAAWPFLREHP